MARPRKETAFDSSVVVGCKLPQGLHILAPDSGIDLKLHGAHSHYAIAGYGITRGVDASLWEKVKKRFEHAAWLKNEAVFVVGDPQSAADRAAEQTKLNVGFNPIDPREFERKTGGAIQPDGAPDALAR